MVLKTVAPGLRRWRADASAFSQEDSAWRRGRSTVPSRPATQAGSGKAKKVSSISRRVDGSSGTTGTKPDVDKTEPAVIPDPKADLTPAPQAVPAESELPPLQDPLRAASDIDSRKLEKERRYKDLQSEFECCSIEIGRLRRRRLRPKMCMSLLSFRPLLNTGLPSPIIRDRFNTVRIAMPAMAWE